ncbi:flavin reductase family protein [Streptomyces sp. CA-210063]|uniref:flavin reductase family protein n=1 Tax=Streptomyces sp. CA-210063 TaxID=2801029 RepID=UPI00214C0CEF|nr:flavin reductase family protein [Streptomyces sp. CA-210063]UUU33117.1 flavin reductase family protein [Streptomyces sp. CA-210063]
MGHAGMAAAAVRYLRSDRTRTAARMTTGPVEALPRPELRCVGENERAPVDQAEFRRVLGNFATGVTVITAPGITAVPAASGAPTVSGAPAADDSETSERAGGHPSGHPAERAGGHPDARPAGFACQSFSALSLDPPLVVFMVGRTSTTWPRIARAGVFCVNVLGAEQGELCRRFAVSGADKFAGVAHEPAPATGSPRLIGAPAWIDCTIHAVHTGGDHLIVVGRVEALGTGGEESAPLLFHRGRFGGFTTDW